MKITFSDFLNVSFNNVTNKIEYSILIERTVNGNKIQYYDDNLSLIEGINLKFFDNVYTNLKYEGVSNDGKLKIYSYESIINYKNYLKENIDINDINIIDEKKDTSSIIFFEKYSENKPYILIDPLFSKIKLNSKYKTILYIPSDKEKVKNFLFGDIGGINYTDIENKSFYAFLLTNVRFEYVGLLGLKTKSVIVYDNYYILSDNNVRFLKIQNLVL